MSFSVAGTYSVRFVNNTSDDITVTGTYYVVSFNNDTLVPVPSLSQEKTNWCWAACVQMCAQSLCKSTMTQTEIVTAVKGSDINEGANSIEIAAAMEVATNDTYTTSYSKSQLTISQIASILRSQTPLIIRLVNRSSTDQTTGHVVVVTAVSTLNEFIKYNDSEHSDSFKAYRFSEIASSSSSHKKYYDSTFEIVINS